MIDQFSEIYNLRKIFNENFPVYASSLLKIIVKSGGVVNLNLNKVQLMLNKKFDNQLKEKGRVRAIILKGRQFGCSTFIGARFYWKVTNNTGKKAFVLTHKSETTDMLFEMIKRFHENMPELIRVSDNKKNAKQINFNIIDSSIRVGTARGDDVGRGGTIHYLHGSEVACWPNSNELVSGLFECVPDLNGTEVVFESTSQGPNNFFHTFWQQAVKGDSEYEPIFISWAMFDEYTADVSNDFCRTDEETEIATLYGLTDGQLQWRRNKIKAFEIAGSDGLVLFKHEYPLTPQEAFSATDSRSFIKSEFVERARKSIGVIPSGPLVIGVDPAKGIGQDRSSLIKRRGRVAYDLQSYSHLDTIQFSNKIVDIIKKDNPVKVFIDVVGVGVSVYDYLKSLGYGSILMPVNAHSVAIDKTKYSNKKHEMWGEMKRWLTDPNEIVSIPDVESLHMDLCSVQYDGPYGVDNLGRELMQSKNKMHKSPDEADALALTFAYPVADHRSNIHHSLSNPIMRF